MARSGSSPRRRLLIGPAVAVLAAGVIALILMARGGDEAAAPTPAVTPPIAAAGACTRNVPAEGDVQRAIDQGDAGDVVCLAAGQTYEQNVTIRNSGGLGAPLVLTSAPGSAATLRGRLLVPEEVTDVQIRGLILDGRNADALPSPSISGARILVAGNEITNAQTGICLTLGSIDGFGTARDVQVRGNRIHKCGVLPATNRDHGIYVESSRGAIIAGNLIHDNADRGIQLFPDAQDTLIEGNVIDANGVGIIFSGDDHTASSGNVVRRNIITNARDRHDVESFWAPGGPVGTDNVVRDNCVGGGALGAFGRQVGFVQRDNREVALRFTDRERFGLPAGEPCAPLVPELAGAPS